MFFAEKCARNEHRVEILLSTQPQIRENTSSTSSYMTKIQRTQFFIVVEHRIRVRQNIWTFLSVSCQWNSRLDMKMLGFAMLRCATLQIAGETKRMRQINYSIKCKLLNVHMHTMSTFSFSIGKFSIEKSRFLFFFVLSALHCVYVSSLFFCCSLSWARLSFVLITEHVKLLHMPFRKCYWIMRQYMSCRICVSSGCVGYALEPSAGSPSRNWVLYGVTWPKTRQTQTLFEGTGERCLTTKCMRIGAL